MTQPLTTEHADDLFKRVVREEMGTGYRGYHITRAMVFEPADSTCRRFILSMFMKDSPVHPRDGMAVEGRFFSEDWNRDGLVMKALNAILSIRKKIDIAYGEPGELRDYFTGETVLVNIFREGAD